MNLVSEMIGFLLSYSQNNAHVLYWAIFAHLHCKLWTGDVLASGDKLPSDHTSKTDVRGQCDNSPTKASSSWGHRGWRDIKPKRSNVFLGHFSKKRREKNLLLPVAFSKSERVGPGSYGAHRLFLSHGCNSKPHWTDVPIEGFLLRHTWAILPSWNQTQNLSLSPP